jgi:type II secretory pathway component PulF
MLSFIKKWWWALLIAVGLLAIIFYVLEAQKKLNAIEKQLNSK